MTAPSRVRAGRQRTGAANSAAQEIRPSGARAYSRRSAAPTKTVPSGATTGADRMGAFSETVHRRVPSGRAARRRPSSEPKTMVPSGPAAGPERRGPPVSSFHRRRGWSGPMVSPPNPAVGKSDIQKKRQKSVWRVKMGGSPEDFLPGAVCGHPAPGTLFQHGMVVRRNPAQGVDSVRIGGGASMMPKVPMEGFLKGPVHWTG